MLLSSDTAVASAESGSANQPGRTGEFFTIDRRCWARVCALGIDVATAYLVLARGSARDNRTSAWSINAIETYTGIGRKTAGAAIAVLKAERLIDQVADGTRPRYALRSAREVPGTAAYPRQAIFTGEQSAYDRIRQDGYVRRTDDRAVPQLIAKGWVVELAGGGYQALPPPSPEPQPIWLPNELVTGAAGETPPVERVRQTRDPLKIRLLVDLYHYHDLPGYGGVDPSHMWQGFRRIRVGEHGEYVVWGFAPAVEQAAWTDLSLPHRIAPTHEQRGEGANEASHWFNRTECLANLGLFQWIPHLFEGDDPGAAPLHVYGRGGSRRIQDVLGAAAHAAGRAMVTDGQFRWACDELGREAWLAPVLRHIDRVQLIGVARLRYRPHTRLTSAWIARLRGSTTELLEEYRGLAARPRRGAIVLGT
jgi:hypothetical protein